MIAKIKKYTLLIHYKDYAGLLDSLREAGVVHIVEKRKLDENGPSGDDVRLLGRYKKAIQQLSKKVADIAPTELSGDPKAVLFEFESAIKELEDLKHKVEILKPEANRVKPWGNFDFNTFRKLNGTGWKISLFTCSEKRFQERWNESFAIEIIGRDKGRLYFALIHRDDEIPEIGAELEKFPERPASSIFEEISQIEKRIAEINSHIQNNAPVWLNSLNKGSVTVFNKIDYSDTAEQADKYAEDNLYILEGWVPVSEESKITELLDKSGCYSFTSEPEENEKIPVILVNSPFAKLFEPISKLFSLPNYREMDLTPYFAPFFMLFFGLCLGDAGYGLIFLVGGFLIKGRVKKEFKPFVTLAQYFGIATILFGLVSGTFFGMNLIDSDYTLTEKSVVQMQADGVPQNVLSELDEIKGETFASRKIFSKEVSAVLGEEVFNDYKTDILKNTESKFPIINSFRHLMLEPISMFYLALIIGALQIIFGMIIKIFNITKWKGFKYSLSTIGWVILALTLIVFKGGASMGLIDADQTKVIFMSLLIISAIFIFLLNSPGTNVFARVGLGIWDSYGVVTGAFGDLLSYIRLFALGISSSILGFVFNDIATQMLAIPYIGWLFFLLMLLVGHSINIALATLGSFVHPMRLTFVEFYKNAGFTGGGIEYKPFKIKQ